MERSMTISATTTEARERALTVDAEEEFARAPTTGLGHHRAGGPSGCLRSLPLEWRITHERPRTLCRRTARPGFQALILSIGSHRQQDHDK